MASKDLFHPKEGIVVPLMPLLTEEGNYDFASVERQANCYIQRGVAGIFALTTCGQSASFSLEENKDLASVVIDSVQGRVPVYVGIGRTKDDPRYPTRMLDHAITKGAQAAVVLCVDRNADEQREHFKELNAAGFPLIAYSLGNQQKQLQRLEEIAALDSVVGLKVTIDTRDRQNKDYFQRAVSLGKPAFMGEDAVLYEALEMGAAGGVTAIANLIPEEMAALYENYRRGKREAAQAQQQRINEVLLSVLYYGKDGRGQPIDAAAAVQNAMFQVLGFGSPVMRAPRPTYSSNHQDKITKALAAFGLLEK